MATNRDIVFVLKLRNEARAGIRQISDDLRRLRGLGAGGGSGPGPRPGPRPGPTPPGGGGGGGGGGGPDPRPVRETTTAYNALARAAQAAVAAFSITQVVRMADAYTDLTNRIRLVTRDENELVAVRRRLIDMSNQNRQDLEATADLYSRIARNAGNLGLTQNEVLGLTDTIGKAMIISGASAQAAQAALIQLGQGFAAGTLRGEELNSVLEQAPRLAQAIAEGMGVTVGELRRLGTDGRLTAQAVVDALQSQAQAVQSEFGRMTMTAGQGFTVLRNGLLTMIGSFNEASGAVGGLGQLFSRVGIALSDPALIQAVADFGNAVAQVFNSLFDLVAGVVQRVASAMAALEQVLSGGIFDSFTVGLTDAQTMMERFATYAATFVAFMAANYVRGLVAAAVATASFSGALTVLRGALIRTGIGAIVVLVGEMIFQMAKAAEKVGGFGELMRLVGDVGREVWGRLGMLLDGLKAKAISFGEGLRANVADGILSALQSVVDFGNNTANTFEGTFNAVRAIWEALPDVFRRIGAMAINFLIESMEAGLQGLTNAVNTLLTLGGRRPDWAIEPPDLSEWMQTVPEAVDIGGRAGAAFNEAFADDAFSLPDSITDGLRGIVSEARTRGNAMAEAGRTLMEAGTAPLQSVAALREALTGTAEDTAEAEAGLVDLNARLGDPAAGGGTAGSAEAAKDAMNLLRAAIEANTPAADRLRQQHDALRSAFELMRGSLTPAEIDAVTLALQRQADVLSGTAGGGIREGARQYLDGLKTMGEEIADFTKNQFAALENVLVDFFMTGKAGFKDFANAAIAELLRIMVRQWVIAPIAAMIGLPVGHVGYIAGQAATATRMLPRYHTGGIGSGEEMAVVRRGEAVLPTARLSDGTLGIRAQGMGGGTVVNNVTVNVDGGGASGASSAQQEALGETIGKQVRVALEQEMARFTQREMRPGGMLYGGR